MKKPNKTKPTKLDIAKKIGVNRSTLYTWQKAGCPVDKGDAAILEWAMAEGKRGTESDVMREAKIAVLRGHERRLQIANDKNAATLISRAEAEADAGNAVRTLFAALELAFGSELPPALHGASLAEIVTRLLMQKRKLQNLIRLEFRKLGGDKVTQDDYQAAKLSAEGVALMEFCNRKAWDEKIGNMWAEFLDWKRRIESERDAKRRAWCIERAAAGLPVPDASAQELAETKGLSRA